jgi:glycosyltransferase involved in cell wall biosynthesis
MPTFSILMPVYNTRLDFLLDALDSVIDQTFSDWELCVVDDGSTYSYIAHVLQDYASKLPGKIKFRRLSFNHGIAYASNAALDMATGMYCCLLDHDDVLHPKALESVYDLLQSSGFSIDMCYTDEDKITEGCHVTAPFRKPDFGKESVLAWMYLNHLLVIKSELIRQVGGFSIESNECPDNDLVYKVIERNPRVVHLKECLYHWRLTITSSSVRQDKSIIIEASLSALNRYLIRNNMKIRAYWSELAKRLNQGFFSFEPTAQFDRSQIMAIVFNRSDEDHLDGIVRAIQEQGVDRTNIHVIRSKDSEYATAKVLGAVLNHTDKSFALLISDQVVPVSKRWLDGLVMWPGSSSNEIVAATGKLITRAGDIFSCGVELHHEYPYVAFSMQGREPNSVANEMAAIRTRNCAMIAPDFAVLNVPLVKQLGGLDADLFRSPSYSLFDLCNVASRRGWRVVFNPDVIAKYRVPTSDVLFYLLSNSVDGRLFARKLEQYGH